MSTKIFGNFIVFARRELVVGGLNTHLTKPPREYRNKEKTQKHQFNSKIPGRESRNNDSRPGIVDSRPGIVSQIQIDLAGSGRMKTNRKTQVSRRPLPCKSASVMLISQKTLGSDSFCSFFIGRNS